MKTLNKIALVSAIAAASFSAQAMEALDDTVLGNTTGQAGVTIVTEADLTIGSIVYTDDSNDLTLTGIAVSGADNNGVGITQEIDVTATGLQLKVSKIDNLKATIDAVSMGSADSLGAIRIDADLASTTTTITSGGAAATGGTGGLTIESGLELTDMDVLYVDGAFTKTADGNVSGVDQTTDGHGAGVFIDSISTNGSSISIEQNIDVVNYDTVAGTAGGDGTGANEVGALAITSQDMTGTLKIGGIKFLTSAQANAAAADLTGDVSAVASVAAAQSIGSITINDFSMAGTTTYIYAH